MIKRRTRLLIKLTLRFLPGIITVITLVFITGHVSRILKNSGYFKIKDILVHNGKEGVDFSYLVGYNIFAVDLKRESSRISELYPAYTDIRLIRVLPNRLFIGFIERKALAYIKLYKYFYVDGERVLLNAPQGPEFQLPVILGLETKIFGARAGKQYNIKELELALNIIREVKASRALKDYKLQKVNVASLVNATCFLEPQEPLNSANPQAAAESSSLQVRLGESGIADKIAVLAGLFPQVRKDFDNIEYIDIRFKEPVIKFKDAK